MKRVDEGKSSNKWILPLAAGIMVVVAVFVVLFIPKGTDKGGDNTINTEADQGSATAQPADAVAETDGEGKLVIYADRLSPDQISFISISEDSKIELLARLGDDGTAKAALGTCQSCNGSPGAYYTQEGDELKCNNCGLTFPVSVLDSPGGGCHPIMIDEGLVQYQGNDLKIDLNGLSAYEDLFSEVAEH